MQETLTKAETLCSQKIIDTVFSNGTVLADSPVKLLWDFAKLNSNYSVQTLIAVPKKKVSKAVDRNSIKRKIREAFRKNKSTLYKTVEKCGKQVAICIIYTGTAQSDYKEIEGKIILTLQRLSDHLDENC